MVSLKGFCSDDIYRVFGVDLIHKNKEILESLISILPKWLDNIENYIRNDLTFCKSCLSYGFHSTFHQIKFIICCPFHLEKLQDNCPSCRNKIPYELNDKYTQAPFKCVCGYSFSTVQEVGNTFKTWSLFSEEVRIKDPILRRWICLNEETKDKKPKLHFNHLLPNNMIPLPEYILTILDSREYKTRGKHQQVSSSHLLQNLNRQKSPSETRSDKHIDKFIEFYNFTDEIYKSSKETFSSIARRLRKTILMNHRTCIKRLIKRTKEAEVCPYAYAYVMWRKEIEGLENYWDLQKRLRGYRRWMDRIEFFSRKDIRYLSSLDRALRRINEERFSNTNVTESKWIFNRVLAHHLVNYFKGWLSISKEMIEKKDFWSYPEIWLEYIPFYILKLPESKDNGIEFHWWIENEPNEYELECPFNKVKKKRNYRYTQIQYTEDPVKTAIQKL